MRVREGIGSHVAKEQELRLRATRGHKERSRANGGGGVG